MIFSDLSELENKPSPTDTWVKIASTDINFVPPRTFTFSPSIPENATYILLDFYNSTEHTNMLIPAQLFYRRTDISMPIDMSLINAITTTHNAGISFYLHHGDITITGASIGNGETATSVGIDVYYTI